MDNKNYIVDGYVFLSEEEALLAKKELDAINYIRQKNNMKNPKVIYQVYQKMINQNLFVTPVGRDYLKTLQKQLLAKYDKKDIIPIPVLDSDSQPDTANLFARQKMLEFDDVGNVYKKKFKISLFINVMLLIAVSFMIFVASTTKSAHILNYENALIDRYEQWEKELEEREEKVNKEHNK